MIVNRPIKNCTVGEKMQILLTRLGPLLSGSRYAPVKEPLKDIKSIWKKSNTILMTIAHFLFAMRMFNTAMYKHCATT